MEPSADEGGERYAEGLRLDGSPPSVQPSMLDNADYEDNSAAKRAKAAYIFAQ
jgi:hypothetical protein